MLFDPRPKTSRKELFDREKELEILDRAVEDKEPLVVVLGIRRIGKTSILKSFLEEQIGVYIDARGINREADIYTRLAEDLETRLDKLKRIIQGIRGIKIAETEIEIKWRGRDSISLLGLLEELNKKNKQIVK